MTQLDLYEIITGYTHTYKARRLCRSLGLEPSDAAHEIYLKLTQRDLSTISKPTNWVARCGWRVLLDMAKKKPVLGRGTDLDCIAFPCQSRGANELSFTLQDAVDTLPTGQRDALFAKLGISTESYRVIAQRNGVAKQTIPNWAAQAAKQLRTLLEVQP